MSEITFEKYVSPNFLGLFVGKKEENLLRSFTQALADEVRESLGLNIDVKGNSESKSSFHLTLAYQVSIFLSSTPFESFEISNGLREWLKIQPYSPFYFCNIKEN